MKKVLLAVAGLALVAQAAMAQDIKVKKGKVTMTEAQYNELKARAEAAGNAEREASALREQLQRATAPTAPRTFNDSASYAIGRDIYIQWAQQNLGIDGTMAGQAMIDCAKGQNRWTDQMARPLLQRFQQNFEQRQRAGLQENIAAGEKYLQELDASKSVKSTPSGLRYKMLKAGNGKRPKVTDKVKVHYTGTLINGTKFDSSVDRGEPITFSLNQVIPGWTEGLQLMDEGSKYMLYIPYTLGYGEQSTGSIPGGSTLVFEVELLEVNPK